MPSIQVGVTPPPLLAGTPLAVVLLAGELSAAVLLGMVEGFQPLSFQSKASKTFFLASVSPTGSSCDVSVTDIYLPLLFAVSPVLAAVAVVELNGSLASARCGNGRRHLPAQTRDTAPVSQHGASVSPTPSLLQGIDEGFAPLTSQNADEMSSCSPLET